MSLKIICFQEFKQTRAMDWQALMGNVGGYVGTFLGYTILQIPNVLRKLYEKIQVKNRRRNHSTNLPLGEYLPYYRL